MNYTLMHEHVHIDLSQIKNNTDCKLDCIDETIDEFKKLYNKGVRNIVDVSNIGIGRDISYIAKVAKESKINILASTGFYKEPFLPNIVEEKSVSQLAKIMVDEIEIGIDGTDIKAAIIGEVGSSKDTMTQLELKVFLAASVAHLKTGVPITTHTTLGSYGLEQIELFMRIGVDLSKVIIGHVDLSGDIDYIEALLEYGVNVEFDTIGKLDYLSDHIRADILAKLITKGWSKQLLMSMDITRKSHMEYKGGIGYSYLFDTFLPMLKARGVRDNEIREILENNPSRILGI